MFTAEFRKVIEDSDFTTDLVLKVNETGLYWKMLPSGTYISLEENLAPGFKGIQRPTYCAPWMEPN